MAETTVKVSARSVHDVKVAVQKAVRIEWVSAGESSQPVSNRHAHASQSIEVLNGADMKVSVLFESSSGSESRPVQAPQQLKGMLRVGG